MAGFGKSNLPTVNTKFISATGTSTVNKLQTSELEVVDLDGTLQPLNMASLAVLASMSPADASALISAVASGSGLSTGTGATGATGPPGPIVPLGDLEDVTLSELTGSDTINEKLETLHRGNNDWINLRPKLGNLADVVAEFDTAYNANLVVKQNKLHILSKTTSSVGWETRTAGVDDLHDITIAAVESLADPTDPDVNVEILHKTTEYVNGQEKDVWVNKTISLNNLDNVVTSTTSTVELGDLSTLHFDGTDWVRKTVLNTTLGDVHSYIAPNSNHVIPKQDLLQLIGQPSAFLASIPQLSAVSAFDRDGFYPLYTTSQNAKSVIDAFRAAVLEKITSSGLSVSDNILFDVNGNQVSHNILFNDRLIVTEIGPLMQTDSSGISENLLTHTWTTVTKEETDSGASAGRNHFWVRYNGVDHTIFDTVTFDVERTNIAGTFDTQGYTGVNTCFKGGTAFHFERSITSLVAEHETTLKNLINGTAGGDAGSGNPLLTLISDLGQVTNFVSSASIAAGTTQTLISTLGDPVNLTPDLITTERTMLGSIGKMNDLRTTNSSLVSAINENQQADDKSFPETLTFTGLAIATPTVTDDEPISIDPKAMMTEAKLCKLISHKSTFVENGVLENDYKLMTRKAIYEYIRSQIAAGEPVVSIDPNTGETVTTFPPTVAETMGDSANLPDIPNPDGSSSTIPAPDVISAIGVAFSTLGSVTTVVGDSANLPDIPNPDGSNSTIPAPDVIAAIGTAFIDIGSLTTAVGELPSLATTNKTTIVEAINEIASRGGVSADTFASDPMYNYYQREYANHLSVMVSFESDGSIRVNGPGSTPQPNPLYDANILPTDANYKPEFISCDAKFGCDSDTLAVGSRTVSDTLDTHSRKTTADGVTWYTPPTTEIGGSILNTDTPSNLIISGIPTNLYTSGFTVIYYLNNFAYTDSSDSIPEEYNCPAIHTMEHYDSELSTWAKMSVESTDKGWELKSAAGILTQPPPLNRGWHTTVNLGHEISDTDPRFGYQEEGDWRFQSLHGDGKVANQGLFSEGRQNPIFFAFVYSRETTTTTTIFGDTETTHSGKYLNRVFYRRVDDSGVEKINFTRDLKYTANPGDGGEVSWGTSDDGQALERMFRGNLILRFGNNNSQIDSQLHFSGAADYAAVVDGKYKYHQQKGSFGRLDVTNAMFFDKAFSLDELKGLCRMSPSAAKYSFSNIEPVRIAGVE